MSVLLCGEIELKHLQSLLEKYGLAITLIAVNEDIPGSFLKPPEAGLIANKLYLRDDTPVHSALHEACHYICMDETRRTALDTDAGGGYEEEDGVCYLQILLAEFIPEMKQQRMFDDMDEWGYSFRLGSSRRWFEEDAEDALAWLIRNNILHNDNQLTWQCRN